MTRSRFDLPLRARAPFFFGYLALQTALFVWAQKNPDFVFGFQMFNASSDMKIALYRKLRTKGRLRFEPVRDGTWQVTDAAGTVHVYRWQDRVHDGVLSQLGTFVHASYGLPGQLYRLQFALQDVLRHATEDHDTVALVAVVDTLKNGRERGHVRLEGTR